MAVALCTKGNVYFGAVFIFRLLCFGKVYLKLNHIYSSAYEVSCIILNILLCSLMNFIASVIH